VGLSVSWIILKILTRWMAAKSSHHVWEGVKVAFHNELLNYKGGEVIE